MANASVLITFSKVLKKKRILIIKDLMKSNLKTIKMIKLRQQMERKKSLKIHSLKKKLVSAQKKNRRSKKKSAVLYTTIFTHLGQLTGSRFIFNVIKPLFGNVSSIFLSIAALQGIKYAIGEYEKGNWNITELKEYVKNLFRKHTSVVKTATKSIKIKFPHSI